MSRRTYLDAVIGLGYLAIVAALIFTSIAVYNRTFSTDIAAKVVVTDAGTALQKGSDVQVRGVLVGEVTGVSTTGRDVVLDVALDRGLVQEVPANVTARLLPKTLFGERYVSLVEPSAGDASGPIRSGDVIRQDTSTQAVELQAIFDRLLPVLQAVRPADLATVLGTIAQTLRGRGGELGDTVTTLSGYLSKFAPQVPTLTDDLAQLAEVAKTYTVAAPDLVDALDRLTTTARTVNSEADQFAATYATVITSSNTTGGFLGRNQDNIITLARDSLPVLSTLAEYSSEFPCIARALRGFVPVAESALGGTGNGPAGLKVTLQIVPATAKYVPGADTPTGQAPAGGPSCPYVPPVGVSGTALSNVPAATQQNLSPTIRSYLGTDVATGLGPANSPAENTVIAEIVAPTLGMAPSRFPQWGSLLLGPAMRGNQIELTTSGGTGVGR